MWATKKQKGFTVVEALIVLAVTGVIFVSTSIMIRGQVAKYQYRESVTQLSQLIQNVIRDTENGYFPTNTQVNAGTDSAKTLQGKRLILCKSTGTCTLGNTKIRVETIKGDPTNPFEVQATDVITIPGGLTYLGYYLPGTATKSPDPNGFNVYFGNLLGSGTFSATGGNVYGAQIGFNGQNVVMYDYTVNSRVTGGGGIPAGMTTANELRSINGGNGVALCFQGVKKGSITYGKAGGLSIDVNYDDSNCVGVGP
jgi:type II secretory pathway pseudopilin PulG